MTRKKPVALLVIGILNLVFGGLGLLGNMCCAFGFAMGYVAIRSIYQQVPPAERGELDELWAAFANNVPGLVPVMIGQVAAALFMAVLQIVSGIGLVRIQNWGRWMCAVWGALQVILVSSVLFYQLVFFFPGTQKALQDLEKWQQRQEQKMRDKGQAPPPRQNFGTMGGSGNVIADNALSIIFSVFYLAYGGLAFLFMVLPQTGKAIARYNGLDDGLAQEQHGDFDDDDYQRRRREQDRPPET